MQRAFNRCLLIGVTALMAASALAQDASTWIARMNSAVEELSYRGTFVHMQGATAENLLIVHINDGDKVSERIVSLDGAGREIIRSGDEVRCILPDSETVIVEDRRDLSPLVAALPSYNEELATNYDFNVHRRTMRIAERRTQIVSIMPRDELRYGYRLWLDTETAMPLKSQLLDEQGNAVEQILFTRIEISDSIPLTALEPTINTEGFTLHRPPVMVPNSKGAVRLMASKLPKGFSLSASMRGPMAGSTYPVDHLVYTDGLATVSVFIEDPKNSLEVVTGRSRLGSANAFSWSVAGRQVTAVGEVPAQTVEAIARALRAE